MSVIRPTWDEYFLDLVQQVATRATCDRGKSGCVVVRERRILTTGYVGAPHGFPHCDDVGHLVRRQVDDDGSMRSHCVRTIHAEQNAVAQAARNGVALEGATVYCTMEPCRACAMLLVSVGIIRVVCLRRYHAGADTRDILQRAGVELTAVDDDEETYPDQRVPSDAAIGFGDFLESEMRELHIQRANGSGQCPTCGKTLSEHRYGSGALRDGLFCSLDCFAKYHYASGDDPRRG